MDQFICAPPWAPRGPVLASCRGPILLKRWGAGPALSGKLGLLCSGTALGTAACLTCSASSPRSSPLRRFIAGLGNTIESCTALEPCLEPCLASFRRALRGQ